MYVIGTQAVISNIDDIPFYNLGLSIIDEEHKFGVEADFYSVARGVCVRVIYKSAEARHGRYSHLICVKHTSDGIFLIVFNDGERALNAVNRVCRVN